MFLHMLQAFFDINVDGQSAGRIVVSLFDDVPIGAQRFMDIADGQDGISYQLSKVAEVGPVRLVAGGRMLVRIPMKALLCAA